MKRLIVTADDFGAAAEVNAAVEQAYNHGILTCASLMVAGDAAADAVARAQNLPRLGVGLHLVLTDGRPLLPPKRIPLLVGPDGRFHDSMVRTALLLAALPAARRQLAAEIEAQFAAFAATGLRLDHVNAHKHFHLHPIIAGQIAAIGVRYGMSGLRAPVEPRGVIGADGPRIETGWAKLLRRRFRNKGMTVPDAVFGLRWSGGMDTGRILQIIDALPDGLNEIYCHPAIDDHPACAPGYRPTDELAALLDPMIIAGVKRRKIALMTFADADRI